MTSWIPWLRKQERAEPEQPPPPAFEEMTFGEVVSRMYGSGPGNEAPAAQAALNKATGAPLRTPGRDALGRFVTRVTPDDDQIHD